MIFDFVVQILCAAIFFAGLAGLGLFLLKILRIKENVFLTAGLAFFVSLAIFTLFSVLTLFVFPSKIVSLAIFSVLYLFFSWSILVFFCWKNGYGRNILVRIKEDWRVLLGLFFTIAILFLGVHKTSLLDEQLHRPVVKSFVDNGIFPLKDPMNPNSNFTLSYHYGMDVVSSAVKLLSRQGVSESLDIVKLSYSMAAFFLFFGILLKWTGKKNLSLWGTLFIFFCGSSFFMYDGFSLSHIILWGQWTYPLVYPLLYVLEGITWVNIPLSIAFLFIIEKVYYERSDYRLASFFLMTASVAGFFLISELFGILVAGWIALFIFYNLYKKRLPSGKFLLFSLLFVVLLSSAVYFTGGVLTNVFLSKTSLEKVVSLKPISQWGYPSGAESMQLRKFSEVYIKNCFLVAMLAFLLVFALIKKKIHFNDHPVLFATALGAFVVPFVLSISLGDLNLYKLTHLAIICIYLLFFCYASIFWKWSKTLVVAIMALFIFGSIPIIIVNYGIQWGSWARTREMHCAYNDLCYDSSEAEFLKNFETKNPGLKYFFTASEDQQAIVDITNSYAVAVSAFPKKNPFPNSQVYIFCSPNLKNLLTPSESEKFKNLQVVAEKGDYKILKYSRQGRESLEKIAYWGYN